MKEALHSSSTRFVWMVQGRPGKLTAPLSQGNVVVFHLLPDVWNVFVRPDMVVFERRQELFSRLTYLAIIDAFVVLSEKCCDEHVQICVCAWSALREHSLNVWCVHQYPSFGAVEKDAGIAGLHVC